MNGYQYDAGNPADNQYYNYYDEYHQQASREQEQKRNYNAHSRQNQYFSYSNNKNYYDPYSQYSPSSSSYYGAGSIPSTGGTANGGINRWLMENYGKQQGNISSYPQPSLSWGIGIALFVIMFFHYRDYYKKYHQRGLYDGDESLTWQDRLLDYLDSLFLYITSFFHALSRLRLFIISPSETTSLSMGNGAVQNNNIPGEDPVNGSRRRELGFSSRSSNMPSLQKIPGAPDEMGNYNNGDEDDDDSIPPAFLTDEEYPEGWLIFNRKLGRAIPIEEERRLENEVEKNDDIDQLQNDLQNSIITDEDEKMSTDVQ